MGLIIHLLLVSTVLTAIIIYFKMKGEENKRLVIAREIILMGYEWDFEKRYIVAHNPDTNIILNIEKKEVTMDSKSDMDALKTQKDCYVITSKIESKNPYKMKFYKLTHFPNVFGTKRNILPVEWNLRIETPNPHHTQFLLSQNGLYYAIRDLFDSKIISLEITTTNDNQVECQVETVDRNLESVKIVINFIEMILRKVEEISFLDYQTESDAIYNCFICGGLVSKGDTCKICKVIMPNCVVCSKNLVDPDEVRLFACCKSQTHLEHGREWISTNKRCPYCRSTTPILNKIEKTKRINI